MPALGRETVTGGDAGPELEAAPVDIPSLPGSTPDDGHPVEAESRAPPEVSQLGARAGVDRSVVEPDRYVVHPEDTTRLADQVDRVGRDSRPGWVGDVNPRFEQHPLYRANCGDCARAFATTAQTSRSVAAAGDRQYGEQPSVMWEWAGSAPTTTVERSDGEASDAFDRRAWDQVAARLDGEPPGTVAIVGVW